ncbi:kinase-like domain-containing protein [Xylaria cf. heliscus]|nr:kinase-like domain-containing protein [Xylaria cf. heliscus]
MPFEYGRSRKVVVSSRINRRIGLGGAGRNLYQFRLDWKQDLSGTMAKVKKRGALALQENSRLAETIDEPGTILPSQMNTRVHINGPRRLPIRWAKVAHLGTGGFGEVCKAVDVDNGNLMAVKTFKDAKAGIDIHRLKRSWKREIEIFSKMNHPNIVKYISCQASDEGIEQIFMGLHDGSLQSLIQSKRKRLMTIENIIKSTCHHILQAIDYLTAIGIAHRDIKPGNILCSEQARQYHFLLSDFGLSNHQSIAVSGVTGTMYYIAPELYQPGHRADKADVWSLYVTLLWTSGNQRFRELIRTRGYEANYHKEIQEIGTDENHLINMREMGALNPEERASAAQMLVKYYDGKGLISTSRSQVPPLFQPPHQAYTMNHQARPMNGQAVPMGYQVPARASEDC